MNKQIETKLIHVLASIGYAKASTVEWHQYMRRKVYGLYAKFPEFKCFLEQTTSFLPKDTSATRRWLHVLDGRTKEKTCLVCSSTLKDYNDKYCCHKCSTLAPSSGAKRGPKVDLDVKAKELAAALPKGYTLLEYRKGKGTKSKFKHSCGKVFEIGNRPIVDGSGSCPCQHRKLVLHTLETLNEWHQTHATGFTALKINGKQARLQHSCGYKFVQRKFYNRHCPKCDPNPYATQRWDPEDYAKFIKQRQPKFQQLTEFVDQRTKMKFKHLVCGAEFEASSASMARPIFRCPACSPKTCGSYRTFKVGKRVLKVRGKENIALDWILKNTSIKLSEIQLYADLTIPTISYRQLDETRTRGYYPDFYVESRNLMIEVKDTRTFGVKHVFFYNTAKELFDLNCLKAKACIAQGYKFKMLLFNIRNERIKLPEDWYLYSHKRIVSWLTAQGHLADA